MRFISWNVNGLRAVLAKGFEDIARSFDADIIALQETKLQTGQAEVNLEGYYQYWSYAQRKGYSGTAIFSKQQPLRVLHGLGSEPLDDEGRIVAAEFSDFWFVDVYTPNAQNALARIDHRMEWDGVFCSFCKNLEQGVLPVGVPVEQPACGEDHLVISDLPLTQTSDVATPKPVVMCGDFNVAHNEIDLKNPEPNRGKAGFSDEERSTFTTLLGSGFIDTFRHLHPDEENAYSWWSYRFKARDHNVGWRIDYFLVSEQLASQIEKAYIRSDVFGSDHCPVGVELTIA